jgi:hypothetical protein
LPLCVVDRLELRVREPSAEKMSTGFRQRSPRKEYRRCVCVGEEPARALPLTCPCLYRLAT